MARHDGKRARRHGCCDATACQPNLTRSSAGSVPPGNCARRPPPSIAPRSMAKNPQLRPVDRHQHHVRRCGFVHGCRPDVRAEFGDERRKRLRPAAVGDRRFDAPVRQRAGECRADRARADDSDCHDRVPSHGWGFRPNSRRRRRCSPRSRSSRPGLPDKRRCRRSRRRARSAATRCSRAPRGRIRSTRGSCRCRSGRA